MDCQICETHEKRFFCASCVRKHIREHKEDMRKVIDERSTWQSQAEKLLKSTEPTRLYRADSSKLDARMKEISKEKDIIRRDNDALRTRVAGLRTQIATRRANLLTARSVSMLSHQSQTNRNSIIFPESNIDWVGNLDDINYQLTQTRRSLVEELLDAFELAETDVSTGRLGPTFLQQSFLPANWNASGLGRHASKLGSELFSRMPTGALRRAPVQATSKWTICGLVLPTPAEVQKSVRREGLHQYTMQEANAAIGHTLHFIDIICFYLGIKLPFEVRWSGGKPRAGNPFLRASSGPSNGNWSRWNVPCALFLRPDLSNSNLTSSISTEAFSIAYSMLAYNVCYLAYTQAVSIPQSQAGNILANLWIVCSEDKSIGRFSHETSSSSVDASKQPAVWGPVTGSGVGGSHPLHHDRVLAAPTPSADDFPLDFNSVVEQLVGRKVEPPSETPGGVMVEDESGDGWAVVDVERDAIGAMLLYD